MDRNKSACVASLSMCAIFLAWVPAASFTAWWPSVVLTAFEVQLFAVAVLFAVRKHWWVAASVLLLSPINVRFWQGVRRYARGNAYYFVERHCFRAPDGNLSDTYRVPTICRGASHSTAQSALRTAPQNVALDLCVSLFGPMPGGYDGPLPSRDEVLRSVHESRDDIPLTELLHALIQVDGTFVKVRPDFGRKAIGVAFGYFPNDACLSSKAARVNLWKHRVLVLAMPWDLQCGAERVAPRQMFSWAATIDIKSGKVLGYYNLDSSLGSAATELAGVWNLDIYGVLNPQ